MFSALLKLWNQACFPQITGKFIILLTDHRCFTHHNCSYDIIHVNTPNECNKKHVGKSSSKQIFRLLADSPHMKVTAGSYRFQLNNELTNCIPYNASAIFIEAELLMLTGNFDVVVTSRQEAHYYGFPMEYEIHILGTLSDEISSLLTIPKTYFGRNECESFAGGTNHRASLTPIHETRSCANGSYEVQVILAESESPLGGSFDLHYAGNSVKSIPVSSSSDQIKRYALSVGIPEPLQVSKLVPYEKPYGTAWAISFIPSNEARDMIGVVDRFTTGKNVNTKVYPMITISTFSLLDDISGHFRIRMGGEISGKISHLATHRKLLEELYKMSCIGKVVIIGDEYETSSVNMNVLVDDTLEFLTKKTLSAIGDITNSISPGDNLSIGSCDLVVGGIHYFEVDSFSDVNIIYQNKYSSSEEYFEIQERGYTLIQTYFEDDPLRIFSFANDCHISDNVSNPVGIGSVVKSKSRLPGSVSMIPSFYVTKATEGFQYIHVKSANIEKLAPGTEFSVGGITYLIDTTADDCGEGCVKLASAYTGSTIFESDTSANAYIFSNLTMITTHDLTKHLSTSDSIFIQGDEFSVISVVSGQLQLSGKVNRDLMGVEAYSSGHGSKYHIIFKSYSADLASFDVKLESDWSGSGTWITVESPLGYTSGHYEIGNPAEIQIVTLKDTYSNAQSTFILSLADNVTPEISWPTGGGQKTAMDIEIAINSIVPVYLKATVELYDYEKDFSSYSYKITFTGSYQYESVPEISSATLNGSSEAQILHGTIRDGRSNFLFSSSYTSLRSDQSYLLRVSSKNERGYGLPSEPVSVKLPSHGISPDPPRSIIMGQHYDDNEISLSFLPPLQNGGELVTKYRVEWDTSLKFSSLSPQYGTDEIQIVPEEQDIILTCQNPCYGSFMISWGDQISRSLPVDATSAEVEIEVNRIIGLLGLGSKATKVTKKNHGLGNKWSVTFSGIPGNVGNIEADDRFVFGGNSFIKVVEITPGNADIYPSGFTNEIQTVYTHRHEGFSSPVVGTFSLEFEDAETEAISVNATAVDFKMALESLDTIHSVHVKKIEKGLGLNAWIITFDNDQGSGDIQMLKISSMALSNPSVTSIRVFETIKGTTPFRYSIKNCVSGLSYFARVYAFNSVGYGAPSEISSATPRRQPEPPVTVNSYIPSDSSNSLIVEWEQVSNDGGNAIEGYLIEWYSNINKSFAYEIQKVTTSSTDGTFEVQLIRSSAATNSLTGYFTLTFGSETTEMISHDALAEGTNSVEERLQRLSTIGDIEVSRYKSKIIIENETFRINHSEKIVYAVGSQDMSDIFSIGDIIYVATEWYTVDNVSEGSIGVTESFKGPSTEGIHVYRWAFGYEWAVTFKSHVGDQPELIATPGFNWSG